MQTLQFGDKGSQVNILQALLVNHGAKIKKDGDFGQNTQKAVMDFQALKGLIPDGVVGRNTWQALHNKAVGLGITLQDYQDASARLGVDVPILRAFARVESHGNGFFVDGRPAILFERHVFYRLLRAKHGKAFADKYAKSRPDIVSTTAGGYQGGLSEWVRLAFACVIDSDCAYQACSWGVFQIMGENWQMLGYASIDEFVAQMLAGEKYHLDAFLRFVERKKGLLDALKQADWDKVFTLYNGKNYKKLGYDYKFLAALRELDV